jgi:hypothetical protein
MHRPFASIRKWHLANDVVVSKAPPLVGHLQEHLPFDFVAGAFCVSIPRYMFVLRPLQPPAAWDNEFQK